jgi:hypothetical protein
MITADRKPFDEIYAMTEGHDRVLVAGCDTCVAICMSGGEREAEILASEIGIKAKQEGRELTVEHTAASASASGSTWTRSPSRSAVSPWC